MNRTGTSCGYIDETIIMKTPKNHFKRALQSGKKQYGYWLGLCSPISTEICANTGYDWLLIDGEHAPNNLNSVLAQLQAVNATASHPIVRLVDDNTATIKQYLDVGAQTLLVPMVETAEQAEQIALAVQYPPVGIRGVGTALARAACWNMVDGYFDDVDNELCLIIQIESLKGIENLDEILAVERIDAVFIGPADLAATMGHLGNPNHPDVYALIEAAARKINAAGKASGTLAVNKQVAKKYEAAGFQFLALGIDTLSLANSAKKILTDYHDTENTEKLAY